MKTCGGGLAAAAEADSVTSTRADAAACDNDIRRP